VGFYIRANFSVCICMYVYINKDYSRFVGFLKLQVSFAEYRLFYRALLKRPTILKSLLIERILMKITHYGPLECLERWIMGTYICVCVCACIYICVRLYIRICVWIHLYSAGSGMATISRIRKIIGLFCKRALKKRQYSAKETYNFKEPTDRSHPILESNMWVRVCIYIHTLQMGYICICIYVYVYVCVCIYLLQMGYICICIYVYVYVCVCTYSHTNM